MRQLSYKHYLITLLYLSLAWINSAHASLLDDANTIFDWAENSFSDVLAPKQKTQTIEGWYYRHYPQVDVANDIYLGINTPGDVYTLVGDDLVLHGSVNDFLAIINPTAPSLTNNPGNGNCVNMSFPKPGLSVGYSLNADNTTTTFTTIYNNTTSTSAKTTTHSTLAGSSDSITTQKYNITNNYLYLDSIKVETSLSIPGYGNVSTTITTTNDAPLKAGPALLYCDQQSWTTEAVTQTTITSGILGAPSTTVSGQSVFRGGMVEAVNESLSTKIGNLNTIRLKEYFDTGSSITWFSIEHGVFVKTQIFDSAGSLVGETELTSIQ